MAKKTEKAAAPAPVAVDQAAELASDEQPEAPKTYVFTTNVLHGVGGKSYAFKEGQEAAGLSAADLDAMLASGLIAEAQH